MLRGRADEVTAPTRTSAHKASGLNLVVAATILWNTVYLERATTALRAAGHKLPDDKLIHVAPLSWEHINLIGDYAWREAEIAQAGQRPLGPVQDHGQGYLAYIK